MGSVGVEDALLPVLVAELADEGAKRMIEELARARRVCIVPVLDAPVDASMHVLEVSTPGQKEPLVVLAEPVGAPTEAGFPLRLHPYGSEPSAAGAEAPPSKPESLPAVQSTRKSTRRRPTTITPLHTQDLLGDSIRREGSNPDAAEMIVGRDIAAGKLVVEELVGIGGMGAVYRARHKQLNKQVAVKVLHAKYRDDMAFCARFHAEALAISQLDHPNVVRILDYGQEPDGLLYLAMDFLSGVELHEVLELQGTLPLPRIVDIAMQVSAGLGHAHARGIVHRDVKPSNIVLVKADDDEGRTVDVAKVCDFGIAAHAGSRDLVGTPAYMSPEQCAGGEVDGRSDIYALGVILYQLATGQLPFNHDDASRIINMHLNSEPPRPSSIQAVDARLEALILKMLAKEPSERPQTMRELRGALRDLLRPPSLELHDVGAGATARAPGSGSGSGSSPPPSSRAVSQEMVAVTLPPHVVAAQLAKEPVSTLRESMSTIERFTKDARPLAGAMRFMLEKKQIAELAHVITIFRKVAADPGQGPRGELAARLVRTMMDPAILAPVAQAALADHDEAAQALLGVLGNAAAHALYTARLRVHPTPTARGRFVTAMRAIGAGAWPIVSAALQRNVPGEAENHDPRLAEDILRSMPAVADETMGAVVAKYLRWGEPAVRRAAIGPLVALWGDRAKALLLAVLTKDSDEGARVAAIKGLRQLKGIDEHVVRKVDDVLSDGSLTQTTAGGDALKQAVAEALGDANEDARDVAASTLKRALTPKGGVLGMMRTKTPALPSSIVVALARSYVNVGGDAAVKHVDDMAKSVEDPLKTQLVGIIGTDART
jgi:eukaryotic-like serine/threonine-protein kinase